MLPAFSFSHQGLGLEAEHALDNCAASGTRVQSATITHASMKRWMTNEIHGGLAVAASAMIEDLN